MPTRGQRDALSPKPKFNTKNEARKRAPFFFPQFLCSGDDYVHTHPVFRFSRLPSVLIKIILKLLPEITISAASGISVSAAAGAVISIPRKIASGRFGLIHMV